MKKWGFLMLIIFCLGFAVVKKAAFFQDKVEIHKNDQNLKGYIDDKGSSQNIKNLEITKEQIYQRNLLLVNNEYPVHEESIKSDVINLFTHKELTEGYGLLDTKIKLSVDVAHQFSEMIAAADKEGVRHF